MIWKNVSGEGLCSCKSGQHKPKLIVLTGGPGAGKTAILELARREFCEHVGVLPESAGIVFGGGFWRIKTDSARKAAQRAIFNVQKETESIVRSDSRWALGLCDRGSLDGLAYWPETEESYWRELKTSLKAEYENYEAVVHLRTPSTEMGYNQKNHLRIETAQEALEIDRRIASVWKEHPRYEQVSSAAHFLDKAKFAIELVRSHIPACCSGGEP